MSSILIYRYRKYWNKLVNSSEKSSKIDYHGSPNFEKNHFRKSDIEHITKSPIYQVKKISAVRGPHQREDYKFHPRKHNYDFEDEFDYRKNIYHTENFQSFYPKRRIENEYEDYMRKIYYDTPISKHKHKYSKEKAISYFNDTSDSFDSDRNYKMHNKWKIRKKHIRSKTPTRIQNKREDNYFDTHLFPDRNYYQSSIGNKRNYL